MYLTLCIYCLDLLFHEVRVNLLVHRYFMVWIWYLHYFIGIAIKHFHPLFTPYGDTWLLKMYQKQLGDSGYYLSFGYAYFLSPFTLLLLSLLQSLLICCLTRYIGMGIGWIITYVFFFMEQHPCVLRLCRMVLGLHHWMLEQPYKGFCSLI